MKDKKKVELLKDIYLSKYSKNFFNAKSDGTTKKGFRIICNISENNKDFNIFINDIIDKNILTHVGFTENKSRTWIGSKSKILKELNSIPYYSDRKKVEFDDYEGILRY